VRLPGDNGNGRETIQRPPYQRDFMRVMLTMAPWVYMTGDTHLPVFVYCADHRPEVGLASRSRGLGSARARHDTVILTLADVATRQHVFCRCTRSSHRPILKPPPVQFSGSEDIHPKAWYCRSNSTDYCASPWNILPASAVLVYRIIYCTSERPNYLSESKITCGG
jgi:hypothetical protein